MPQIDVRESGEKKIYYEYESYTYMSRAYITLVINRPAEVHDLLVSQNRTSVLK